MESGFLESWSERGIIARLEEKNHLLRALTSGPQRIKFGIDPTAPELHLGHAAIFRILKKLQDTGHIIVLIIGDFTAQIGDPSGRSETRKMLSEKEAGANEKRYLKQAGKFIDIKKAEIRHNSEWLKKGGAKLLLELMSLASIQQMLERQDFKKRMDAGQEIALLEALYPVLQGYDSVAVNADIEVGGSDQEFNLLAGRRIQRKFGKKEQDIMTIKLLVGTDGVKKMSKSFGNFIGLEDASDDVFGKIMSISDAAMQDFYYPLLTDIPRGEYEAEILKNPRDAKLRLAFEVVAQCHGEAKAKKAKANFIKMFSKRDFENAPIKKISGFPQVIDVMMDLNFALSRMEARRLIWGDAVEFDGETIRDPNFSVRKSGILIVGKKKFAKLELE
ncbi:MAG: tyrosine--tRNA ligase [Candidatus Niyogibacteria bacterium]|nr:tyrosine--tRNA ligase [Candidatus Niyogibacteria bacterium]